MAFTYRPGGRELTVHTSASNRVAAALTQDLGVRVHLAGQADDDYWSSGTAGAHPMVIEEDLR